MNSGRTVFSQLMSLLPLHAFRKCVQRYRGDYKVQSFLTSFSSWRLHN